MLLKRWLLTAALLALAMPAAASTYQVTLDPASFTRTGVAQSFGNGYVFASPDFTFETGDTIDFGTAIVAASTNGKCFPTCPPTGIAGIGVYGLVDGIGGLDPNPLELFQATNMLADLSHLYQPTSCAAGAACALTYALLFTIPNGFNGLQLGFQGTSVSFLPPVPLPAAWLLLAPFLLVFARMRR